MRNVLLVLCVLCAVCGAVSAQTPASQPAPSVNQPLADAIAQAMAAKQFDQAITKAKELDGTQVKDLVWSGNAGTICLALLQSGKPADALTELKARAAALPAETTGLDVSIADARSRAVLVAGRKLLSQTRDVGTRLDIAKLNIGLPVKSSGEFNSYFSALEAAGKNDEALQACLDYASDKGDGRLAPGVMRNRRLNLMVRLNRDAAALSVEATQVLKLTTDPKDALGAIRYVVPPTDVSLCAALTAQQVLDNYKVLLRKQNAQLNTDALLALSNQLTKGGDARPLTVSDEAKALAEALKDAPLSGYLVPLLKGDHAAAFKVAYAKARDTKDDLSYIAWINAAAGALRCLEQSYNGKALQFVQYVNGKATTNPASDLLAQ